jgi:NAD(P)-dependent dehydrogenase (short-subunit alcohol dehydrogenase family)
MKGMVILVTGANGGLGSVVVQHLLEQGATVAGTARNANQSLPAHPEFLPIFADLASAAGASEAVRSVLSSFSKIDGIVHTVGGFFFGALHQMPDLGWQRLVDENLNSAFYLLRAALEPMRDRRYGRIVMIGSLAAAQPQANLSAYVATKAALHALVQSVALESRDFGITINAILPGTIDTAANRAAMPASDPSGWLPPQKLAKLCAQLLSDPVGILTGALLPLERR